MDLLPPFQPFEPPFGLRGGHAQTLAGALLPSTVPDPPWERLNLKLPDGDALSVRMVRGRDPVVVHLFHGLAGNADSDYIRRAAHLFWQKGHSVVAINHRGAGEGRGLASQPYHAGSIQDLSALFAIGRGFFPEHLHVAVAYSISANMLLLLLGSGDRGLTFPDRAVAVNPPTNLEASARRLEKGLARIYDRRFVKDLRREVQERWELGLMEPIDFPRRMSLRDFDALYTAPKGGFWDREQYYARCSCAPHLRRCAVPTVLLTCEDDPIAPASDLSAQPLAPSLHLHVERHGGHMGYLSARPTPLGNRRWLDYAVDHYVDQLILSSV